MSQMPYTYANGSIDKPKGELQGNSDNESRNHVSLSDGHLAYKLHHVQLIENKADNREDATLLTQFII
ncbi:hypothetical protein J6590_005007 [Homalodisca vitripennis]|nr:hypothetical protein J6590_005007 [Homalodisca vitripennis]